MCLKKNLDSVIEIISFSEPFYREQNKIHGNELILFETAKTNIEMMANNFGIITISIIWRQNYRKEEKMDLKIVTDGKNDKTEKN